MEKETIWKHLISSPFVTVTPLLCPAYSTYPFLRRGNLKLPLIFIILVVINEVHHLCFYHLRISPSLEDNLDADS